MIASLSSSFKKPLIILIDVTGIGVVTITWESLNLVAWDHVVKSIIYGLVAVWWVYKIIGQGIRNKIDRNKIERFKEWEKRQEEKEISE